MSKLEQVLQIDPAHELHFKGPFTEVASSTIKLYNPTEKNVCFKVKTTAPKKYCVRPNSGIVQPQSTVFVAVMLEPHDFDVKKNCCHKFMIQSMIAVGSAEKLENIWKEASADQIMDSKLKCVFDLADEQVSEPIPSYLMVPGGLKLGQIIVIQGFIPINISKASCINLMPQMGSENDIFFHMSLRFHENCIVRNTKHAGRWGSEERGGGIPLTKGQQFQMLIAVHQNSFKVAINGRHFTGYNHRASYQQINVIGFKGEFQIQSVFFQQDYSVAPSYPTGADAPPAYSPYPGNTPVYNPVPSYPTGAATPPAYSPYPGNAPVYNPPVPYNGAIPGGLYPGRMITIQGTPNHSPTRFHINLSVGADIALHFNPRFNENCAVRNTKLGGSWGQEERHGSLPFVPGGMFDIKILVEPNCYKVAVNNQHYCEYNHRLNQLNMIQGLQIGGDVQLTQIFIQ